MLMREAVAGARSGAAARECRQVGVRVGAEVGVEVFGDDDDEVPGRCDEVPWRGGDETVAARSEGRARRFCDDEAARRDCGNDEEEARLAACGGGGRWRQRRRGRRRGSIGENG